MTPDELLREIVMVLEDLVIPYAIGGSVASIAYGEPRATLDIDIVIDIETADVARLAGRFDPDAYMFNEDQATAATAERGQFNVIHPGSGQKIGFFVVGDSVERSQIQRARRLPALSGLEASFSPPEELILKKLQYYEAGSSDKHLRDIASMLSISPEEIDRDRIGRLAAELGLSALWESVAEETESKGLRG